MPDIEIYTTRYCPYCLAAKRLLSRKGVAFIEIDVSGDQAERSKMVVRANGRMTVPQIFIGAPMSAGTTISTRSTRRASSIRCSGG